MKGKELSLRNKIEIASDNCDDDKKIVLQNELIELLSRKVKRLENEL